MIENGLESRMTTFRKNDRVALISSWDNKGTVQIRRAVVQAWGKKIARLQDPETGGMFRFEVSTQDTFATHRSTAVADGTDAELEAIALEAAEMVIEQERERIGTTLAHYAHRAGYEAYRAGMRKALDELHEPRIRWHSKQGS